MHKPMTKLLSATRYRSLLTALLLQALAHGVRLCCFLWLVLILGPEAVGQTVTYPFPAPQWPSGFAPTVPTSVNETGGPCSPVNISFTTAENVIPPFWYLRVFSPWGSGIGGVYPSFDLSPNGDPLTVVNGLSQGQGTVSQTSTVGTYPAAFGTGVGAKGTYTITIAGHIVTEQYALNIQFNGPAAFGSLDQNYTYLIASTYDVESGAQTYSFDFNANQILTNAGPPICVQTEVTTETGSTSLNWSGGLQITTGTLLNGTVNVAYPPQAQTLNATGGTQPYTWSVVSGALPDGLSLAPSTGVISGTPTKVGVFSFTVQVTDSNGLTATKLLSIDVVSTTIRGTTISQGVDAVDASSDGTTSALVDIDTNGIPDLVANRNTLVRVFVKRASATDTSPVTIDVTIDGAPPVSASTVPSAPNPNQADAQLTTPNESATTTAYVTAMIHGTQVSQKVKVEIIPVRDVRYVYFALNGTLPSVGKINQDEVQIMANQSQDFIANAFPVSEKLKSFYTPAFVENENIIDPQTSLVQTPQPLPPVSQFTLNNIYCQLWVYLTGAERCVAFVTPGWFTYWKTYFGTSNLNGVFLGPGSKVAYVQLGTAFVAPHELGHSYLLIPTSMQNSTGCIDSQGRVLQHHTFNEVASGYWYDFSTDVNQNQQPMTLDYMNCFSGSNGFPTNSATAATADRWSTPFDFSWLFKKFSGLQPDPEVLLVDGSIGKDNSVQLGPSYRSPNGIPDVSTTGDAAIQVKDASGNVISQVTFPVAFSAPDAPVITGVLPFALSVPYPTNAAVVEFVRSGQMLAKFTITTKLLVDAINSIPDSGFVHTPSQLRNALLLQVRAMDLQLSAGNQAGAAQLLQNGIRTQLVDWLIGGYATQTPLEYTKQQILDLVDELVSRLGG